MRKGRKRRRKWKIAGRVFLVLLLLSAVGALVAVKGFTVDEIEVKNSEYYSDKEIKEWLLMEEHSWNSLYVFFRNNFAQERELPFVESIKIALKSPHVLEASVQEKELMGCVYIAAVGQYAYFEKDGVVVEMSSRVISGVPQVKGLDVDKIILGEKLPIKGKSVLKNLLSLSHMLKKHEMAPDIIKYGQEGSYTLKYGKISVLLGQAHNFNEKVIRISHIMPKLEGQKGVLHLESWTDNTTDVTFEKTK